MIDHRLNSHSIAKIMTTLGIMLLPFIGTLLLVYIHLDKSISDFVPNEWNDQVLYWREVQTFSDVGFNGGYYATNEVPAKADFTHFGSKGPQFAMLYGTIAQFTEWDYHTSIYINLFLVSLALGTFCYLARLDVTQILITGLIALLSWIILLYIPTSSHESLHQAAAIILAGIFYWLLAQHPTPPQKILFATFLIAIALFRFSWVLLLFPLIFLSFPKKTFLAFILTIILGAVLSLGIVYVFRYVSSGDINTIYQAVDDAQSSASSLGDTFKTRWDDLSRNIDFFTDTSAPTVELIARLQVIALIVLPLVWTATRLYQTRQLPNSFWELVFHSFNLASILGTSLLVYHPRGYYRLIGIHLLLSLLLLVAFKRYRILAVILAMNLFAMGSFLNLYNDWEPNFSLAPQTLAEERTQLTEYVVYDENADDVWCNTVLVFEEDYDYRTIILPSGIGASLFVGYNALSDLPKSRYALLPAERFARLDTAFQERNNRPLNFQLVAMLPVGNLYYNLDRNCSLLPQGYQPPDHSHLGLSDATFDAYQNHLDKIALLDENALIFNPATDIQRLNPFTLSPAFRWANLAEADTTLDDAQRNQLFELIAIWENMRFESDFAEVSQNAAAIQTWRTSKSPEALAQTDIGYVFFDDEWQGWLTPQEQSLFADSAQYQLLRTWQDPLTNQTYYLYRLVSD